ncbi:MAG: hypothetical protein ACOCP8_04415 [archaeon]
MIFLNDWAPENCDYDPIKSIAQDFSIRPSEFQGVDIVFASYTYEYYEGDAFVLFIKDGKLYEVNGGHCSCYGLESQWEPEETSLEAIRFRIKNGSFGYRYHDKLVEFLNNQGKDMETLLSNLMMYKMTRS